MPLSRRLLCLTLLAVLAGAGTSAWAGPQSRLDTLLAQAQGRNEGRHNERPQQQHDRAQDQRALSDAVRRAERATRGQVLSAERVPYDGRNVNRIKVIDNRGRVRVYMDDPQNPKARQPQPDPPTRGDDD